MNGVSPALVPPLLGLYDQGHRDLPWRTLPTPYRVWISEIMLQQTRVEAVRGYFDCWMDALPDIRALAEAEESVYMKLWEGLGYYSRVRNLHRAAVVLCQEYGGQLPADYDKLLSLPGIGEYTAGAIASIAYGIPVPAVDGNVLRVAARLDNDFTPITDVKYKKQTRERFAAWMPADRPGDLNQALMELGATVCLPNGTPRCGDCPLQHLCLGYHTEMRPPCRCVPLKRRGALKTAPYCSCAAARSSACGSAPPPACSPACGSFPRSTGIFRPRKHGARLPDSAGSSAGCFPSVPPGISSPMWSGI